MSLAPGEQQDTHPDISEHEDAVAFDTRQQRIIALRRENQRRARDPDTEMALHVLVCDLKRVTGIRPPVIDWIMPLSDAVAAHRLIEA